MLALLVHDVSEFVVVSLLQEAVVTGEHLDKFIGRSSIVGVRLVPRAGEKVIRRGLHWGVHRTGGGRPG